MAFYSKSTHRLTTKGTEDTKDDQFSLFFPFVTFVPFVVSSYRSLAL